MNHRDSRSTHVTPWSEDVCNGLEYQNSTSPVAARVLERDQMGIIIMVGNLYSACASEAELDTGIQCKAFNWEGGSQEAAGDEQKMT